MAVELCEEIDQSTEGVSLSVKNFGTLKKSVTHITSARGAKAIGRPIGTYVTIEFGDGGTLMNPAVSDKISDILAEALKQFLEKGNSAKAPQKDGGKLRLLIIGLGNNKFVVDSLGPKVCEHTPVGENLAAFAPGILATTGLQSTDTILAITRLYRPTHVVIVDTLVCHESTRLGSCIQISDTGITPGSGITRDNKVIDRTFLGVPVIAIGMPLVIYEPKIHYVIPKMVDALVASCALSIANAIAKLTRPLQVQTQGKTPT